MRQLTATEVHATSVEELGLDPTALDLTSIEALAGALRRTASFLCPCAATTLVRGVVRPLRGLVDDLDAVKGLVEDTLEAMIAYGDIHEHRELREEPAHASGALLYAAPASFVARQSGATILLGVAADQLVALPDDLARRVEYVGHVRRLSPLPGEKLLDILVELGLVELTYEHWLKAPAVETAAQHLSRFESMLEAAQPSRDVPGLLLLDPERPVHYYPRRWVKPRSQSGRFVARRDQAYGAPLWCYVQMRDGNPERLIDFPNIGSQWRGCDEAWHLQMAIDAQRGEPQRFKDSPGPEGSRVLEFLSPVPMWARRRWDAVGESIPRSGCLFAYRLPESELQEELRFVHKELWLDELTKSAERR